MLSLRIDYLTGRCVATAYNNRRLPEWPPHPARVYSALFDAWVDQEPPCDEEARALDWLASAGAPAIFASQASERHAMTHFVPVNDTTVFARTRNRLLTARAALDDARAEAMHATTDDARARRRSEKAVETAESRHAAAATAHREEISARDGDGPAGTRELAPRMLPASRSRQPRHFPSVTPHTPTVHLVWDTDLAGPARRALATLAGRVHRIGHSTSLVHCSLGHPPDGTADWTPDDAAPEDAGAILRVPRPDQRERLAQAFDAHRGVEPRVLPCRFQRYRHGRPGAPATVPRSSFSDDWLVFRRTGGPRLPITTVADVAGALRGALLAHAEDPTLEALSGHDERGNPSALPHAAFVPLPFVGHQHATGALLGAALVLPAELETEARRAILRAIGRWEAAHREDDEEAPALPLRLGRAGVLEIERVAWTRARQSTLRPRTWCRAARAWISATPVALDRNPGDLYSSDASRAGAAFTAAEEIVARACTRIGLPLPDEVVVLPAAGLQGAAKARDYPPFPRRREKTRRVLVHARLTFSQPVRGPVLLGAGRFRGLGLFAPADPLPETP